MVAVNLIKSIFFRFGVPHSIITDNGSNFTSGEFKQYCAWVNELPSVVWSLRTTPNIATQETPFFLVHGAEAVLPVKVTHDAPRVTEYEEVESTKALEDDVDTLDEAHDVAITRATTHQQNICNYHSHRLCPLSIEVGDLVLRLKQEKHRKLESPWLGPYIITEVIPGEAYRLKDKKSEQMEPYPLNVQYLYRFYS
jgi:hypothetical protein